MTLWQLPYKMHHTSAIFPSTWSCKLTYVVQSLPILEWGNACDEFEEAAMHFDCSRARAEQAMRDSQRDKTRRVAREPQEFGIDQMLPCLIWIWKIHVPTSGQVSSPGRRYIHWYLKDSPFGSGRPILPIMRLKYYNASFLPADQARRTSEIVRRDMQ